VPLRIAPIAVTLSIFLSIALVPAHGYVRQSLDFAGFEWYIRSTEEPEGPMNNIFGGRGIGVERLEDGGLRLSITYYEGIWYAAEVFTRKSLGYGSYTFRVRTPLVELHQDAVLGLFTYSQAPGYYHREIDIEVSAWGKDRKALHGQFVVQPYTKPQNMFTFPVSALDGPASFRMVWSAGMISFYAWKGYGEQPPEGDPALVASWKFTEARSIPKPSAQVHMNLYLVNGKPPRPESGRLDVIIDGFEFKPEK